MAVENVNYDNLSEVLEQNKYVILHIGAPWCTPYNEFKPVFEALSAKFPNVKFGKVDITKNDVIAKQYHAQSIPALVYIRNCQAIKTVVEEQNKENIIKTIRLELCR